MSKTRLTMVEGFRSFLGELRILWNSEPRYRISLARSTQINACSHKNYNQIESACYSAFPVILDTVMTFDNRTEAAVELCDRFLLPNPLGGDWTSHTQYGSTTEKFSYQCGSDTYFLTIEEVK